METLEAISTRHSVRQFTEQAVEPEKIEQILQAAMNAPSAGNEQPWHFVVVTDRNILDSLVEIHPYARMCLTATVAIIPCLETELEKHEVFGVQDLSAATENMLLATHALGLGAVWVGVYPKEDRMSPIQALLNLPKNIQPFCIVPIGYAASEQKVIDRYNKDRVHHEHW
ncbi:MAG: nitroreductase family protein [Pseudomonadota bacterium]|nr:nitroreductase family protein [Gammaproteobacteria bacterium]MBU1558698.1 nitroreductase family protein [Gammaproteobacteria bacterium]MBU1629230.1 nitroreductase family protein [Gammaproteobacteria bacterium]MBU1926749.1 nitroreductase family protein [Gammaproteobacteria bacterium]MBU2546459.1 nitroreductase family protein [Gammaproteobacteria bacterium]